MTTHPKLPLQWVPRSPLYYNSPFTFNSTPVRAVTQLTHLSPPITNTPQPTLDPALDPPKSSPPMSNPVPVLYVAPPDLNPPPDSNPMPIPSDQPEADGRAARLAMKKEKFKLRRATRLAKLTTNPQSSPPTLTSNPTTNPTTNPHPPPSTQPSTQPDDEAEAPAPANDIVNFPHTYDFCPALPTCPAHCARFEVYLESLAERRRNPPPDLLSSTTGSGALMSDGMWYPNDGSPYLLNNDLPQMY